MKSATRGTIKDYKDLTVWQKAMEIVRAIYILTKSFPQEERFVLVSQMRRSAVSVPSNIAEGSRRRTRDDYRHFIFVALGSCAELETQIIAAEMLGYITQKDGNTARQDLEDVMRLLNGLQKSLTASAR